MRDRERCSRVYPERELGYSLKLCLDMTSASPPPPCCAAVTATEHIPAPKDIWRRRNGEWVEKEDEIRLMTQPT
jgi:hypothetical protein